MADETTQVEETTVPTPTEVVYNQPDTKKHVYISIEPTGYQVNVNKDRKSWTATGPEGVIGDTYVNRQAAYDAINDIVFPDRKANGKPEKPKQQINGREKIVLAYLTTQTAPRTYEEIEANTEIKYDVVLGVLSNLSRRKFVTLSKEGSAITDLGKAAEQSYTAPTPTAKTGRVRTAVDARTHDEQLVARYGPRPEGLGPSLSTQEMFEVRLEVAKAGLLMSEAIHRNNPYSAAATARHENSKKNLELAQQDLEDVKNGKEPAKRVREKRESNSTEVVADDTDVPNDGEPEDNTEDGTE